MNLECKSSTSSGHAEHSLRNIVMTLLASAIVAMVSAIVMQGRELARLQVRLDNLNEKVSALSVRIERLNSE
jgi:uncharacterized membrane-anchored protein YitT (DUF2179 family)